MMAPDGGDEWVGSRSVFSGGATEVTAIGLDGGGWWNEEEGGIKS